MIIRSTLDHIYILMNLDITHIKESIRTTLNDKS